MSPRGATARLRSAWIRRTRPHIAAWSPIEGLSLGQTVAAVLPVLIVYAELSCLGANTVFLSAAAAVVNIATALVVVGLVGRATPAGLWTGVAPSAVLFGLAVAWGAIGLAPEARPDWTGPYLTAAGASGLGVAPDRTLLELAKLVGVAAIALATAVAASTPQRMRVAVVTLLTVGVLHTLASLMLYALDPDTVVGFAKGGNRWRFTGTLLNANAFGCSLAMVAAMAAAQFRLELRGLQRTPAGARSNRIVRVLISAMLIVLFAAACGMTLSRTSLAALAAAVLFVIFWPSRGADVTAGGARSRLARWGPAVIGVVFAAGLLAVAIRMTGGQTLARLSSVWDDLPTRLGAFQLVADRIGEAPLFGYGLGSFAAVVPPGQSLDLAALIWNMGAAHNAWLQAALEGGVPFAILLTLSAATLFATAFLRRSVNAAERSVRIGAAGALFVAIVCSMVDIALNVPAVAAQAMLILGLLTGAALSEPPMRRSRRSSLHAGFEQAGK